VCNKQIPSKVLEMTSRKYLTVFITIAGLTVLYFLPINFFTSTLADRSYCLHHQIFGFGCPGCGLTRATYFFLHQRYSKAIELNIAVFFAFPALASEMLYQFRRNEPVKKVRFMLFLLFCLSLLTVYIIRFVHH